MKKTKFAPELKLKIVNFVFFLFFLESGNASLPLSSELSLAPMLERITPAVVNISTEGKIEMRLSPFFNDPFFRRFFDVPNQRMSRKTQSLGSGVIIDAKNGLIITNNHVVKNADEITIKLSDGRSFSAELVGRDADTDVAVVKINGKNLIPISLSDSDTLRVGDFVVAIGNPFGLGQTVTSGIVSALGRSGLGVAGYEDLIQTDASINPGNSGGALVNLDGRLVGVNTAIYSQSGGNIGIGFAIPTNMASEVMEQLVNNGKLERGFIGVKFQDLTGELVQAFSLNVNKGAVVTSVLKASPADKAGMRVGDVITVLNGKEITGATNLKNRLGLSKAGTVIELTCLSGGAVRTFNLLIKSFSDALKAPLYDRSLFAETVVGPVGASSPLYEKVEGAMIVDVKSGGPLWNAGLRKGDVITGINGFKIYTVEDLLEQIDETETRTFLNIRRGNQSARVLIQ